tara:strand:- start:14804 stop:16480 length:1677 start_codon:yes stop_codon:yes gene_type:complete
MLSILHKMDETVKEILNYVVVDIVAFLILITLSSALFYDLLGVDITHARPWTLYQFLFVSMGTKTTIYWVVCTLVPILGVSFLVIPQVKIVCSRAGNNARWMNLTDAKKSKLFDEGGIILGKKWGRYLRVAGWEHVICFAPSGTGKTVSMTIPNLLSWDGSCVCTDIKLELFKKTSKFRESCGIKSYLWNPGAQDFKTHCYNPLDMVGNNKFTRVDELHKIANILIPDNGKEASIWVNAPRSLFIGIALFVLDDKDKPNTIGEILRTIKGDDNFDCYIEEALKTEELDPICRMNLNSYLSMPGVTRGGVKAGLESSLCLFENPIIDAATSKSDFNIKNLRKEKMTIYVGVTNDNIERLAPLLNMFFQQVMDVMTRKEPNLTNEPYGVLFLLDEFTALRRMELFKLNIGLLRSYRIRLLIIIQDITQLYDTYGHNGGKAFLNLKVRVALTQTSPEDAEYISKILGKKSVSNISKSIRSSGIGQNDTSHSISSPQRALMLGQEIMKLPEQKNIIMIQGLSPISANKVLWYKDSNFKNKDLGAIELPVLKVCLPEINHKVD